MEREHSGDEVMEQGVEVPVPNNFVPVDNSICAMLHEPVEHITGSRFVAFYPTTSTAVVVHNGYGISSLTNHHKSAYHAISALVVRENRVEFWLVMDRTRRLCWTARPAGALQFLMDVNVSDSGGK